MTTTLRTIAGLVVLLGMAGTCHAYETIQWDSSLGGTELLSFSQVSYWSDYAQPPFWGAGALVTNRQDYGSIEQLDDRLIYSGNYNGVNTHIEFIGLVYNTDESNMSCHLIQPPGVWRCDVKDAFYAMVEDTEQVVFSDHTLSNPRLFVCDVGWGDFNGDCAVDAADAAVMFANWGIHAERGRLGDINHGGLDIDAFDAGFLFASWTGDPAPVPEPTSSLIGLLVVGWIYRMRR